MFTCENCKDQVKSIVAHDKALWCWPCHDSSKGGKLGLAPSVHGDECDVTLQHGLCNSDGTPKRWRSKEEIKRAAFDLGYFQGTDTPKSNPRLAEARQAEREKNSH